MISCPAMLLPSLSTSSEYAQIQNVTVRTLLSALQATNCDEIVLTFPPIFDIIHSCGSKATVSRFSDANHTMSKNLLRLKFPWMKHAIMTHGITNGRTGSESCSSWYECEYVLWQQ